MLEMEMERSGEQARDRRIGKPVLSKPIGITLRRRCETGKMRKANDDVSSKGKASSLRPRWLSFPLRQQTSRRIARLRSGQPGKALDRSAASEARTLGRRHMLMPHSPINECGGNLSEIDMLKLPPTDIDGPGMDSYPPAELLGIGMHPDPQNEEHIGGGLTMTHSEMNYKEGLGNVLENKDIGQVQEKPEEEGIDERKGIDLYLSPAENRRLMEEVGRLKCSSFICRLLGGRPSKGLLRDMLQATLLDKMPPIQNILRMGLNYYHVILEEGHKVQEILDHKWLTLKYGKAMILEWSPDFDAREENKKAGTPMVITVCFPDLPFQLHHLIPKLALNIGMVCTTKPSFADKVAEMPKMKVLVSDIKKLPSEIRVHTEDFGLRVVKVGYEGLPGQCFACKEMGHMAKHCPLYGNARADRGQQGIKLPDIPKSRTAGHMVLVHNGKQVVKEKGWISPRKVAKPSLHGLACPPTSGGSISNRFDILSQMEPQEGEIILATPFELLPRVETHEALVEPSEGRDSRFSSDLRVVKAWIRKGKDKESEVDVRNIEAKKMITRTEVGNPSTVGVEFVMMQALRMQDMQVPKVVVNISNPRGRVHGWTRAHMVLFNSNSGRPETGCSFDLEPDLKNERGEDSSLKSFCNRATLCFQYLTSENEVVGLQTLWKSSPLQGELMELAQDVPVVCIWKVQDLGLKPGLFHFHCAEVPKNQEWKISVEWEFIWRMIETYLSSMGDSPLAFFVNPSQ